MPLYDNLLTQAGGRQSNTPVAQQTGAASYRMKPSVPSAPAPPSIPAGAVGRPSSRPAQPSVPVGGAPTPPTPAAPVASPAKPPSAGTPKKGFGDTAPPQGGAGGNVPQTPGMTTNNMAPGANVAFSRVPTRADWAGLLPGVAVKTPYGTSTMGADGEPVHTFDSPESEARYRQDEANYAAKHTPSMLDSFPGAPKPRVKLGRPFYDVWSGSMVNPSQS